MAVAALIVMGGGAVWMHGNLNERINRLEVRYDSAHAQTTETLVDIQVQLATLAAKKEAGDQPSR